MTIVKSGNVSSYWLSLAFTVSLTLLATFTLATPSALAADTAAPPEFVFNANDFEQQVERGMQQWQVPGLAVAVVTKDSELFSQTLGTTRLNAQGKPAGARVDEHTVVPLSSTSKGVII